MTILSSISELLIIVMVWHLGSKQAVYDETENEIEEDDQILTETGDFSEDDELQARIWNDFMRDMKLEQTSKSSVLGTSSSSSRFLATSQTLRSYKVTVMK